jgi:hypothetical protein
MTVLIDTHLNRGASVKIHDEPSFAHALGSLYDHFFDQNFDVQAYNHAVMAALVNFADIPNRFENAPRSLSLAMMSQRLIRIIFNMASN